jgi:hypothetical protein
MGDVISQPLVGKISDVLGRLRPSAPVWTLLQPFGVMPDEHLVVALIAVTIPGALVTAALFMRAARAAPAQ